MEKFKDIWASIVSQIHERTTNPLTFSFVVGWLLWNYRFVFIAVSELPVKEKLSLIKSYYPDWHIAGQEGFLYPLLTSLAYVFAYPFITKIVVNFYRQQQVDLANSVRQIEKVRLLTREDATALIRNHEKALSKATDAETELILELKNTREALQTAEEENRALEADKKSLIQKQKFKSVLSENQDSIQDEKIDINEFIAPLQSYGFEDVSLSKRYDDINIENHKLNTRQLEILSTLSEETRVELSSIISKFNVKRFYIEAEIDGLIKRNLTQRVLRDSFRLTQQGRAVLSAFVAEKKWSV